jgi:conjugative relaxase-like TrwC/TraI family protein
MLSWKTQTNLVNAETYFDEHLRVGEYYNQDDQTLGRWQGFGAERLGLRNAVQRDDFLQLCQNLNPVTGERLTQRHKTTRLDSGHEVANRRIFYDFTFSPPKSVSLLALVAQDQRLIEAHDRAVVSALAELEQFAATRVHEAGQISDRLTGNIIAATFRHNTSRALDPHLHTHCILFNATYDDVEGRWKAMDNFEMLQAKKFVENVYYHELVKAMKICGYEIQNHARGDFQVEGVASELCQRFSKRHQEIDSREGELLAQKPNLANGNVMDMRENIAHKERPRKVKDVTPSALQSRWDGELSPAEKSSLCGLVQARARETRGPLPDAADRALSWAEDHLFNRHSVVRKHELWRHALEHARGEDWTVAELKGESQRRNYVSNEKMHGKVTTREMLLREYLIVSLAHDGISRFWPLAPGFIPKGLADDQKKAVERILNSRNFITLFRGGAGTGKSFALQAVNQGLTEAGHSVLVVTPQRQQAIDLAEAGFQGTQTVSELLATQRMPRGGVVLVDEAGQIGAQQMLELLKLVEANGGRVILSGDTRQHGAVEASDALRAIEKYSGIVPAELTEIRRQNPALGKTVGEKSWIKEYRAAVAEAQAGDLAASFDRLDRLGVIIECKDQTPRLVAHFLELAAQKQLSVVVSQTWDEIHRLNESIRKGLQARGLIDKEDAVVTACERRDLTPAQKRDKRFYDDDSILVFQRRTGGIGRGEMGKLWDITDTHLLVEAGGHIRSVSFDQLEHFHVCRPKQLKLASGDRLQLKSNGETGTGRKLANGELVTVKSVSSDGRIRLADGRILEKHYREFVRGYAVTSYASQGKTVDYVLFSDSAVKAATNDQQWYVTTSRGRKGIRIFTSDRLQLRESVVRSGRRTLALELACESERIEEQDARRRVMMVVRQRVRQFISQRRSPVAHKPEIKNYENQRRGTQIRI